MLRANYYRWLGNNLGELQFLQIFNFSSTDFTAYQKLSLVGELKTKFSNDVNNRLIKTILQFMNTGIFPGCFLHLWILAVVKYGLEHGIEASIYNMHQTFELLII